MCIKCTWEYAYHNASKSEANVRVLVVIRLRKSMHTGLKYPYVSTRSDASWHLRRGVEWWFSNCWVVIFQLFCFILWRFIFTEFMYIKKKLACVEWQDEMAKIKMKEQKLQKVEGNGIFLQLFTWKLFGSMTHGNFYKENYGHSDKLGEVTCHLIPTKWWHGNYGYRKWLGLENSLAFCCPDPRLRKLKNLSTPAMHFLFRLAPVGPLGLVWVNST